MAPKHIRGQLGSMFQFFFTLGVMTSYWVDYGVSQHLGPTTQQWQIRKRVPDGSQNQAERKRLCNHSYGFVAAIVLKYKKSTTKAQISFLVANNWRQIRRDYRRYPRRRACHWGAHLERIPPTSESLPFPHCYNASNRYTRVHIGNTSLAYCRFIYMTPLNTGLKANSLKMLHRYSKQLVPVTRAS